jgi:hypothetical protein
LLLPAHSRQPTKWGKRRKKDGSTSIPLDVSLPKFSSILCDKEKKMFLLDYPSLDLFFSLSAGFLEKYPTAAWHCCIQSWCMASCCLCFVRHVSSLLGG